MKSTLAIASLFFFGLISQQSFAQTTTTLTFDTIADDVAITNQYSAQGVSVSGANAINAAVLGFASHSGTQVAYAPNGLMNMSLSIANVKTVSAYVTGPQDVGIYAYDVSNNLVGQAVLPANAPANTLLSVTSSGAAITKISIHDGGASFAIDDLSFTTAAPTVPACRSKDQALYDAVNALSSSAFVCSKSAASNKSTILKKIADFEKLRAAAAGQKKLLTAMQDIQKEVKSDIKAANAKAILQQIDDLIALIKSNGC
ncbi:MAG: hypothetical protein JSU04_18950 [Bdellovibrionales bacterium]|nr:hypothetical protein [Bdellovibrionales bacterium]